MITVAHGGKLGHKKIITSVIGWSIFFNISKSHKLQWNRKDYFWYY